MIGVAAADFSPPLYYTSGAQAQKLLAQGTASHQAAAGELEAEFRRAMHGQPARIAMALGGRDSGKYIAQQARSADLMVCGAATRAMLTDPFAVADPADLVMQVGRPLLVVPQASAGRSVQRAGGVEGQSGSAARDRRRIAAAAEGRHRSTSREIVEEDRQPRRGAGRCPTSSPGCPATASLHRPSFPDQVGNVAAQLDRIATRCDAGVMVAGAYGHSRFREWILGGVTQYLVEQAARCALLAR